MGECRRNNGKSIYRAAWDIYYTPEHMQTILRRAGAFDIHLPRLTNLLLIFSKAVPVEGVHPLQGGLLRRKYRRDRRHGMPIEPVWTFYPKLAWETVSKTLRLAGCRIMLERMRRTVRNDPNRYAYVDPALTPVADEEGLELFTHNEGARNEVERTRKIAALTRTATRSLAGT